jgi:chromosome segregation ATPase
MMEHVRARLPILILTAAWLATLVGVIWQTHQTSLARHQATAAEQALAAARARTAPAAAAPSQPSAPEETGREVEPAFRSPDAKTRALLAQREAEILSLQQQLAEAHIEINRLNLRVNSFDEDQRKATEAANIRFNTAQADWQKRFDALTQQVQAAQAEAEAARARAEAIQSDINKQAAILAANQAKLDQARRLLSSLQDLNRRRNVYLDSLLRRYRDVLSQLHAIDNVLDSARDQNSSVISNAALARIESTISLAEDDMHQLSDLNGRAALTEKRLSQIQ